MSGIPVKPASRQMIWTLVHKIRRALGVDNELYFDIIWFVEKIMPKIFTDFTFAVLPNEELGKQHGKATIPSMPICLFGGRLRMSQKTVGAEHIGRRTDLQSTLP